MENLFKSISVLTLILLSFNLQAQEKGYYRFPALHGNDLVFTSTVLSAGVKLSMDGKGRATDNALIERLWRSVKYEKMYIHPPTEGVDLYQKLKEYMYYYNNERRHSCIEDKVPATRYITLKPPLSSSRRLERNISRNKNYIKAV